MLEVDFVTLPAAAIAWVGRASRERREADAHLRHEADHARERARQETPPGRAPAGGVRGSVRLAAVTKSTHGGHRRDSGRPLIYATNRLRRPPTGPA